MLSSCFMAVKDTVSSAVLFPATDDVNPLFDLFSAVAFESGSFLLPDSEKSPPWSRQLMQFHLLRFCISNHHLSRTPTQQVVYLLFSLFKPERRNSRCSQLETQTISFPRSGSHRLECGLWTWTVRVGAEPAILLANRRHWRPAVMIR